MKTTGGTFQLYMRRTQTEYFNLIIRPDKEKSFRYRYKNADGAKSETVFSENYSISMNVDYLLKIVHSDTQTSVYIKENSDGDYTLVGSIDVGVILLKKSRLIHRIKEFSVGGLQSVDLWNCTRDDDAHYVGHIVRLDGFGN